MQVSSNRIDDIRKYYTNSLAEVLSEREAKYMVDSVLSYYTNIPALQLAINLDKRVGESLLLKIHFAVKDLLKFRPLQYVLGETEFYGMRFFVNESVLIPRPETEELVELIVADNSVVKKKLRILDVGTGSGCIAVSLSKSVDAKVFALDVSEKALTIASKNAVINNASVQQLKVDVLDKLAVKQLPDNLDIIVSNPPYVRKQEKQYMQNNVLEYEPDLALFVEDLDPLIFYKAITHIAITQLAKQGQLWFEINEYLAQETKGLLEKYFNNVELISDYKSKPRFIKASGVK
ncbi:MAG: peptide chain release factor N(5)-glutamine methyltransferase [Bacteroidales bacterium]|nr:peptide chain release factor N(5)-glutamine methyltransferase [Bacteroidales bacterium]